MWERLGDWVPVHRRGLLLGGAVLLLSLCAVCCLMALLWPPPTTGGGPEKTGFCIDPRGPIPGEVYPTVAVIAWSFPPADAPMVPVGVVGGCVVLPYRVWFMSPHVYYYWKWP